MQITAYECVNHARVSDSAERVPRRCLHQQSCRSPPPETNLRPMKPGRRDPGSHDPDDHLVNWFIESSCPVPHLAALPRVFPSTGSAPGTEGDNLYLPEPVLDVGG